MRERQIHAAIERERGTFEQGGLEEMSLHARGLDSLLHTQPVATGYSLQGAAVGGGCSGLG